MGKSRKEWNQFGISVAVLMLLPLLPGICELYADYDKNGNLDSLPHVLALTAATFVASVGLTSRYGFFIFASICASGFFSFQYGLLASGQSGHFSIGVGEVMASAAILFVVVIHMTERYIRHVLEDENFLDL